MPKFSLAGVCATFALLLSNGPSGAQPIQGEAVVERVSATEFILEPTGLDRLLQDPQWLARQGRVVPKVVNGQVVGFTLAGVRKGSFWALLGLSNGDVIRGVNGLPLSSPAEALAAYSKIRGSSFVLDLVRAGAPLRIAYTLRGQPKAVAPPVPPMPVAPDRAAPSSAAPPPYRGGGRLRAHVALDFGDTPGDVKGTLRVMTDAPVIWGAITGTQGPAPAIDFGRGELLLRVSPGEGAPAVEIVKLTVDGGDLAVTMDPQSTLVFEPGRGLEGSRLDLRMTLKAGAEASQMVRDALAAGAPQRMLCSGSVLAPRCRLETARP